MKKLEDNQLEEVSGGTVVYGNADKGFCCGNCDDCGSPIHTTSSVCGLPERHIFICDYHSIELFGKTLKFCNSCYQKNKYSSKWRVWLRFFKK